MNLDMAMFHQAFFDEAVDLLADLEGLLLRLEETPDDPEMLATIFRCAHSLKGGSSTFGFTDIAALTHSLETLLDQVRNGLKPVTRSLSQLLFESLDQLNSLLAVARGERDKAADSTQLIARIEAAIAEDGTGAEIAPAVDPNAESVIDEDGKWGVWAMPKLWRITLYPGINTLRSGHDPLLLFKQMLDAGEIVSVECDAAGMPPLAEMDPESLYIGWKIDLRSDWDETRLLEIFDFIADDSEISLQEIVSESSESEPAAPELVTSSVEPIIAEELDPAPAVKAAEMPVPAKQDLAKGNTSAPPSETHTLRVSTDKIDKLINLVGELVISQAMLNEVVSGFSMDKLPQLTDAVMLMERASRDLQERVMAVRLLPIKHAFGRFPRLVRDLAASCGKKIDLKTNGEDTELDKTVIEAIADPLTHLIRNSIDHGLESPEDRKASGKPETGTVTLNAFHEGGKIVVEVCDDGRGLDKERILRKAVERGLIPEGEIPPDDTIYNFIFHPGFSTAAQVTDISGRGVGMDIVRQAVQALGGSINLNTTLGQGTRFRIRLPLTMAILEGLSLSVGGEVYILPLTSIVESIRPKASEVRKIGGQAEVAVVRGEVLPILRLYQIFGAVPYCTDPSLALLVIVENDTHKVALLVDELIGQSQFVIKSLETNYRKVEGVAGATILGDGRVALILDVPGLVRSSTSSSTMYATAA